MLWFYFKYVGLLFLTMSCLTLHKIQATILDLFTYARDGKYVELDMSVKCRWQLQRGRDAMPASRLSCPCKNWGSFSMLTILSSASQVHTLHHYCISTRPFRLMVASEARCAKSLWTLTRLLKVVKWRAWNFCRLLLHAHTSSFTDFLEWFAWILGEQLDTYLHLPLGADEVSGSLRQIITAICNEGAGLTLCDQLSQGYNCTCCHVAFEVLLWRFLCNN
jgi:hypothetical protein